MWKRLRLVSELESDLRETLDWGKKLLVDFKAGKTQLVSFERSYNSGAIDVKMDGSVLEEVSSLRCFCVYIFCMYMYVFIGFMHLYINLVLSVYIYKYIYNIYKYSTISFLFFFVLCDKVS